MIGAFYRRALIADRVRNSPHGELIERFAAALTQDGYERRHGGMLLSAAWHVSTWAFERGLPLADLSAGDLTRFARHAAHCSCSSLPAPPARGMRNPRKHARVFVGFIKNGRIGDRRAAPRPVPLLVARFIDWLKRNRGVREATMRKYERILCIATAQIGDEPSQYNAARLRALVMTKGAQAPAKAVEDLLVALRGFLRFLIAEGLCDKALEDALPRFRCPPADPLPAILTSVEVERILATIKPTSTVGLRDRAILLLLVRLGLRAGDVATMRISDVLWDQGLLRVRGKSRRENCIPLPQDAGDALLAYLSKGRPRAATDVVFVRVPRPVRPFASSGAVTNIWVRALRLAGVRNPAPRRQILRHTAATNLARAGLRPASIATVLRHRSISMTAHYTHTDARALKGVVQPWPLRRFR